MARSFQDIEPLWKYREGEAYDIIELQLKDFRKDQLKVCYGTNGILTVSGERPLEGTKWIRFRKEFNPPKDSKANEIRARLSSGTLYITIPKKTVQPAPTLQDQVTAVPQAASQPVEDEGKTKPESGSSTQQITMPTEKSTLQTAATKSFIARFRMGRKTVVKVVASVTVLSLLLVVLFYLFKYYAPVIINVDQ